MLILPLFVRDFVNIENYIISLLTSQNTHFTIFKREGGLRGNSVVKEESDIFTDREHLNYTKIHQRKYTSSYATGHMWGNNEKVLDIIYNFLNYLDLGRNKIKHFSKKFNEQKKSTYNL